MMAQMQTQPMAKPNPVQQQSTGMQKPVQQPMNNTNIPPKQSGFMKWLLIILAILIVVGGIAYWILAP